LRRFLALAVVTLLPVMSGDAHGPQGAQSAATTARGVAPSGLVLQLADGERRVRRRGNFPFIIKVDKQNGGSPELVMGYEDVPVGGTIAPHRHLSADEIIFVHSGAGVATVGERESPLAPGSTIYIPRNVRITLKNTGTQPMAIAFVFSKPGFEDYLRDTTVPEGQPAPPLSDTELARIRRNHMSHTVYEQ
jgi:quercetin dioxygenase-like cupin family protein